MKFNNALDGMPGYGVLCAFCLALADGELMLIGKVKESDGTAYINCEIVDNLGDSTWYHAGDVTRWAIIEGPEGDFETSLYGAD